MKYPGHIYEISWTCMMYGDNLSAESIRLIFHCLFLHCYSELCRIKCMLLYRIIIKIGKTEKNIKNIEKERKYWDK